MFLGHIELAVNLILPQTYLYNNTIEEGKGINELIQKVKDIKIKGNHKKRNADNKISFELKNIIIKLKYVL